MLLNLLKKGLCLVSVFVMVWSPVISQAQSNLPVLVPVDGESLSLSSAAIQQPAPPQEAQGTQAAQETDDPSSKKPSQLYAPKENTPDEGVQPEPDDGSMTPKKLFDLVVSGQVGRGELEEYKQRLSSSEWESFLSMLWSYSEALYKTLGLKDRETAKEPSSPVQPKGSTEAASSTETASSPTETASPTETMEPTEPTPTELDLNENPQEADPTAGDEGSAGLFPESAEDDDPVTPKELFNLVVSGQVGRGELEQYRQRLSSSEWESIKSMLWNYSEALYKSLGLEDRETDKGPSSPVEPTGSAETAGSGDDGTHSASADGA